VRALTEAVVEQGGVLGTVTCAPPLTLRQVRSDDPDVCALCLVGTAAGPLAGDDLTVALEVRPGASATLQAAGANLAQGRGGLAGSMTTKVLLGAGSRLVARPGAVVVASGSRVDVSVRIDLAADSHVDWREIVVLGRSAEAPGAATLRWDVTRAGRPVLRQFVDLTDPATLTWPGLVAGGRIIATSLVSGPSIDAVTQVASPTAVAARIDAHTQLVTVLGTDTAAVNRQLDELCNLRQTATVTAR
jgi:urease accessory protein